MGELAGKVSSELIEQNPRIEWRGLKSLRNRIVHDYDGVNLNMIWGFLSEELDEPNSQNIKTGDRVALYIAIDIFASAGLLYLVIKKRK